MLRMSLAFLKSLTNLPSEKIRKIPKFVQMLHENRNAPSLHFEHLRSVDLFSAKLDRGYRAILMRRQDDYILLQVGTHDQAYRWAEQDFGSPQSIELAIEASISITPGPPKRERLVPCETPVVSTSAAAAGHREQDLRVGGIYTWNELKGLFEWDLDKRGYYLRERNGRIVCACLRADLNPSAPWEILVGKEESHIRQAELLAREPSPIPVFVKEAVDQWEYWGNFQFERYEKDQDKIRPMLPENRVENTSMVVYLAEVG
jgi:hypothetical protein